jgi:hypothetical protein
MEDANVRTTVSIAKIILVGAVFGGGMLSCRGTLYADKVNLSSDGNSINETGPSKQPELAAYYGFGEMESIKLAWGISNLIIADFNGDGRNDMAIANNTKARIELFIQKQAIGPDAGNKALGLQDEDINLLTPPSRFTNLNVPLSQRIYSLVAGDLNGDGRCDLAFYGDPKGLYVILQSAEGEDKTPVPSWRAAKKISIDDGLVTSDSLVCADLNNDGRKDLALAARDAVYIILQKPDGSLAEPVKYPSMAQIRAIMAGDLNGDKLNDLVIVTDQEQRCLQVRFGLKTGQLGPQEKFFIETPFQLVLADIDGKPGDEVLNIDAVSGRLIAYKYAGAGKDDDWPVVFYPLPSDKQSADRDLGVGDFDGEGLTDLVVSSPGAAELVLYRQHAGLGLSEPNRFPAFADITSLSVADIDGDDKSELAVLSVKEKVIGLTEFDNERLVFPKPVTVTGEPLAMELADMDGNGKADCVYVSRDEQDKRSLRVIYNTYVPRPNAASLEELVRALQENAQSAVVPLEKLTSNPDGIKVLDVDQDSLPDVLIFVRYDSPILVRQVEKGKFSVIDSAAVQAGLIKAAGLSSIAAADVDGKGSLEMLLAEKNFARSLRFDRGLRWSIIDQYNARSTENSISAAAAFKLGADGPDAAPVILLLDAQKGRLQLLKAGDDKTYRFDKELDVGTWNTSPHLKMLFAPLTGGRGRSILLFDGDKFALVTPPTIGGPAHAMEQIFSYETTIREGAYGNLASGDINNDGWVDITMVEYRRNHIEILALDRQTKPVPAMRFQIFEHKSYHQDDGGKGKFGVEPRELTVADVTGDGKNDLVAVIHDRIIIYPQD